jgi:hypothetical protein
VNGSRGRDGKVIVTEVRYLGNGNIGGEVTLTRLLSTHAGGIRVQSRKQMACTM